VSSSCIEANRGTPSATFDATMRCRVVSSMQQFLDEFSKLSPEPFRLSEEQRSHGAEMHKRAASDAAAAEAASAAAPDESMSALPE
jgi:hypothetical protein